MKRVLLAVAVLLMVFMVGSVSANQIINYGMNIKMVNQHYANCLIIETKETLSTTAKFNDLCFNIDNNNNHDERMFAYGNLEVNINGKEYHSYSDAEGYSTYSTNNITKILIDSTTTLYFILHSDDNSIFTGYVHINLDNTYIGWDNIGQVNLDGVIIDNTEQRINLLEQNQSTQNSRISILESWKTTISDTITNLIAIVTGHTTKIDNYETRITALENKNYTIPSLPTNFTHPYFKYLGSSVRKNIVCGYAEDNELTNIIDLGYNCTITYRTSSSGRVSSSCKCSRI